MGCHELVVLRSQRAVVAAPGNGVALGEPRSFVSDAGLDHQACGRLQGAGLLFWIMGFSKPIFFCCAVCKLLDGSSFLVARSVARLMRG